MHLEQTIEIAAPPALVWEIMVEIERWPEWTASITSIARLDRGPFGIGSRARVLQPKLRPALFEVTALEPGRSFTWVTRSTGLRAVARHAVAPAASGSRVTLTLDFAGVALLFLGWWVRRISVRYMTMEAEGLKQRAEGGTN